MAIFAALKLRIHPVFRRNIILQVFLGLPWRMAVFHGEFAGRPPVQAISDDVLFSPQKMVEPSQIPGYLGYPLVNIQKAMENHMFFIGKTVWYFYGSFSIAHC